MNLLYDGSFRGFLTTVFTVFKERLDPVNIEKTSSHVPDLFEETRTVNSREDLAKRVILGIKNRISPLMPRLVLHAFLTGAPGVENTLLACVQKGLSQGPGFTDNLADPHALALEQLSRRCLHEYHLFLGIVRFRQVTPGCYYAPIQPENNILPLLGGHFSRRLGDQDWIIHDLTRGTALIFSNGKLEMAEITLDQPNEGAGPPDLEDEYFSIWRTYYENIGIADRKNPRLRMNFLPKKYWKHLPEMKGEV